jgi:hypothetical protein
MGPRTQPRASGSAVFSGSRSSDATPATAQAILMLQNNENAPRGIPEIVLR